MNAKEKPIIFSAPMIRAILSGAKSQTRRIVKPQPPEWVDQVGVDCFCGDRQFAGRGTHPTAGRAEKLIDAPFWHGDRLWVREAWRRPYCNPTDPLKQGQTIQYRASSDWHDGFGDPWRSPIFMPRWASRITLEVTSVRVERVQEISEADVTAEGVVGDSYLAEIGSAKPDGRSAQIYFAELWDSIHGPGAWARNDWVWVISFRKASARESIAEGAAE